MTEADVKLFYIGRRDNPQLQKPYFKAYGRLSAAEAAKKTDCLYGSMSLESFATEAAYSARLAQLKAEGFRVSETGVAGALAQAKSAVEGV